MRSNKFISGLTCMLMMSAYACTAPGGGVTPSPSPTVSASGTASPVPSSSATANPSPDPSASASSVPTTYTYDLPLKITQSFECDNPPVPKTTYEVKADGTYTFTSLDDNTKTQTKQLSAAEITDLKQYIANVNIASFAEADQVVPPGSPQTEECRTIESFAMIVNGQEKSYDRNGRSLIHTKEYVEAFNRLKYKLDSLKSTNAQQKYIYNLPVSISSAGECGDESGAVSTNLTYSVSTDGTFDYITDENDTTKRGSRKLTDNEINELKATLNSADLGMKAESDQVVPPGSPQTLECRTIESLHMYVSGTDRTFDRNGRSYIHTQAYLDAFNTIKAKLVEMSKR